MNSAKESYGKIIDAECLYSGLTPGTAFSVFFRDIIMKSHIVHYISFLPVALVACLLLSSCSDDYLYDRKHGEDSRIRFDLSTVAFGTRSGANRSVGGAIRMDSGDSILYLNPEITPGITVKGGVVKTTRSSSVDSSTIEDFGVYAETVNGDVYMDNVEVTRVNGWAPEKDYLWPGDGNLSFVAYSPYGSDVSVSEQGTRIIKYNVPAKVEDQKDLLIATPVRASSSPCNLEFNHVLTAIRFVTGDEMAPCEVKKIEISGVPSSGTVSIEDGIWGDVTGSAKYSVSPSMSSLTAAEGSPFVAASTPITSDSETFLMIPGMLPDEAEITLSVVFDGIEKEFTASIGGQEWPEGTTVTYRLSAKPESNRLMLDVLGSFLTEYPGQTVPFRVRSCYIKESGDTIPVEWRAEFVDDNGNVIEQPEWMKEFPLQGVGMDYTKAVTKMQRLTFTKLSEQSKILQETSDINSTSGNTPYNVANSTGGPNVENTANCYIINAPGKYSLPVVYGNAIKNGAVNSAAYTSTSHNANALKAFVNHLDKPITSPYIADNSDCQPAGAILIWEGRLDLIRNVKLESDRSITFEIPAESIRQGNAIIGVLDKNGNVMWSWNIWVTDYNPDREDVTISYNGTSHEYYTRNIGRIMGGDVTVFPHCETKIRFTQVGTLPEGMEPLTTVVDFNQTGITTTTEDCYNFYQWGRKDPMKSETNEWFDADHYQIKEFHTQSIENVATEQNYLAQYILHPDIFYTGSHDSTNPTLYDYTNLWNTSLNTTNNIKSIYDPSPVGSKVPLGNDLMKLLPEIVPEYAPAINGSNSMGFYFTLPDGIRAFFPLLGYRSGASGTDRLGYGTLGDLWLAQTAGGTTQAKSEARCIVMSLSSGSEKPVVQGVTDPRSHGFGIRPIKE